MNINQDYVWYVGYGSNLSNQRFLCYILGGIPKYGGKNNQACTNRALPLEDRPIKIPYSLYFALPEERKETSNWGKGGVAFITPEKVEDKDLWTLGRMWKITKEQYEEVKKQVKSLRLCKKDDASTSFSILSYCYLLFNYWVLLSKSLPSQDF